MKREPVIVIVFIAAIILSFIIPDKSQPSPLSAESLENDRLLEVDRLPTDAVQLQYTGFNVAFSPKHHQPYCVMWSLEADEVDSVITTRDNHKFMVDNDVDGCATLADYRGSGYDRGHMAPAGDMKWSDKAMRDCHFLTNICPQANDLNSRQWASVEKSCRRWVKRMGTLYICAGPILNDYLTDTIGPSAIPVPDRFFKVIIAPHATPPQGIAFVMPNHAFDGNMRTTATSIDEVETITGYDFFATLPDSIENHIESQTSFLPWNY